MKLYKEIAYSSEEKQKGCYGERFSRENMVHWYSINLCGKSPDSINKKVRMIQKPKILYKN